MLGVSTGGFAETDATVSTFIEQTAITFPVIKDNDQSYTAWNTGPSITPYPVDIVIDGEGNVVFAKAEYDSAGIVAAIESTL